LGKTKGDCVRNRGEVERGGKKTQPGADPVFAGGKKTKRQIPFPENRREESQQKGRGKKGLVAPERSACTITPREELKDNTSTEGGEREGSSYG